MVECSVVQEAGMPQYGHINTGTIMWQYSCIHISCAKICNGGTLLVEEPHIKFTTHLPHIILVTQEYTFF